jgi:hypothetical protein
MPPLHALSVLAGFTGFIVLVAPRLGRNVGVLMASRVIQPFGGGQLQGRVTHDVADDIAQVSLLIPAGSNSEFHKSLAVQLLCHFCHDHIRPKPPKNPPSLHHTGYHGVGTTRQRELRSAARVGRSTTNVRRRIKSTGTNAIVDCSGEKVSSPMPPSL